MRYTVVWTREAESELAQLWLRAQDRAVVTHASHALEEKLKDRPLQVGESRASTWRIMHEEPLGIMYEVIPDDRIVNVLSVWRFRT